VIKRLVADRIPQQLGVQGAGEIQVITPMHRGIIGAQNLNRELQALLNPKGSALVRTGAELRVGDKVMQTANDYEKDVFNGDIGFVSGIEHADHLVCVEFEGRTVPYDFNELDDLDLAYAITVHKSQGSEYRAVVMPVHTTHFVMLQRNLLYTGITRGKAGVWLVGQRRAVSMAVDNISSSPRHSALGQRLAVLMRDA
jgi:exodeoxyribonuclease V alpha subunit